jgi:CheY-like chemotaxis protein
LYDKLFEITAVNSAKDALNILKQNENSPFSLVLTDLQMETDYAPKLAGEWLVEHVKQLKGYDSSKIIIISSMYNIEEIAKRNNVDCIAKPMLFYNKLLMKYMFEKHMPFLEKI